MKHNRIKILDCTLRDGGLGLYDAYLKGYSQLSFTPETRKNVASLLVDANIDIIELGCIDPADNDSEKFAVYKNIEELSKQIPARKKENQHFAALYRGPDTPEGDIVNYQEGLCDIVRVILRYSELQKSLDFCAMLAAKGYKVCIQPMLTMRYTDAEIEKIITSANNMKAYALYFVDSYGYMEEEDIVRLFNIYDKGLDAGIKIGFHAHNNMELAFSNSLSFIKQNSLRHIIADSCILGLGQGAGNLQTEIITNHLNSRYGAKYDYTAILNACEEMEQYCPGGSCGYSVMNLLPAINRVAYKYAVDLRTKYKLSFAEINRMLLNIPEDLRHRYTEENVEVLLKLFNHEKLLNK